MPPEPRILLDECVPLDLRREFPSDWTVHTVQYAGLKGLKNGKLLAAARDRYDVIVTLDQGFEGQQNIPTSGLSLITVAIGSEALRALRVAVPTIVTAALHMKAGETIRIEALDSEQAPEA